MAQAWKLRHDLEWIGHAASSPLSIGNADASGQTPPLLFLHFHAAAQRFIKRNGVLRNLSSRNDQFILQRQQ